MYKGLRAWTDLKNRLHRLGRLTFSTVHWLLRNADNRIRGKKSVLFWLSNEKVVFCLILSISCHPYTFKNWHNKLAMCIKILKRLTLHRTGKMARMSGLLQEVRMLASESTVFREMKRPDYIWARITSYFLSWCRIQGTIRKLTFQGKNFNFLLIIK